MLLWAARRAYLLSLSMWHLFYPGYPGAGCGMWWVGALRGLSGCIVSLCRSLIGLTWTSDRASVSSSVKGESDCFLIGLLGLNEMIRWKMSVRQKPSVILSCGTTIICDLLLSANGNISKSQTKSENSKEHPFAFFHQWRTQLALFLAGWRGVWMFSIY